MSYGIVNADQYRQGATYVDQMLRGAKLGNLPVQTPWMRDGDKTH